MKRHPSLAHLSRDHHGALLLARLLQRDAPPYKGLPTDLSGKAAYAIQFYKDELVKHFESEEIALKLVTGIDVQLDKLIAEICLEHQQLNLAFKSISQHTSLPDDLDALGKALELHVRKEERELFPLIENICSDVLMAAIDRSLSPHD
jgi:iron-sulfur cluster repair protein YtfE (RIC family)